jgi:hypothetical protein
MAAVALFAIAISARAEPPAPNLTGSWVLERSASRLHTPSAALLDRASLQIEEAQGVFTLRRLFVVAGTEQTFAFSLPLGGSEAVTASGSGSLYSRLYVESDAFIYSARTTGGSSESTNIVHYRLTPGGKRLVEHESVKDHASYVNLWVYTRIP